METDSNKQEKFRKFIKSLKEDKNSFYTKEEVAQLKTYNILLFDYFIWNRLDSHLQLFRSFLYSETTGDTFAHQFLSLR